MTNAIYKVTLDPNKIKHAASVREPVMWCVETFGPIGPRWDWRFINQEGDTHWTFYFGDQSDFTQFTLAWR